MMKQPSPPPTNNSPLIRASELTQYGFCHRAWWLGTVKGLRPSNQAALARGTQRHSRHADKVRAALRWRYLGLVSLGAGSFLFVIAVVLSIL
jgi:hypothetical protein